MNLVKENKFDIIFLGLAKNVEKTISYFFESCEDLSTLNLSICVIVGENGSNDGTRQILENYKTSKFNFIYLNTDFLDFHKNRILRLANGREFLKNYIVENKIFSKFVSIVDLDTVISKGIDKSEYLETIRVLENRQNELFAISSKSLPYYYDMLPLIIKDYFEHDVYKIQTTFSLINFYKVRKLYIYNFQKKITQMRDALTVSSHNGLTTYFYKNYITGNYIDKSSNSIKSEHINFNLSIHEKSNKYILMTNKLNLNTPPEHMPLNLFEFIKRRFIKFFNFI